MVQFPILHTERLDLIEIQQSHLGDLYRLFSDEEVTRFYNLLPFRREEEAQKLLDWFCCRFRDGLGIRWGIVEKGNTSLMGTIGFNNYTKFHRANIGYDLRKVYWHQGYMTEALREVIDYAFDTLEVNRIEAEVMQGNKASDILLGKAGFRKEGILREWMYWNNQHYDMTMFSLLKSDWNKKE